jgi:hypothetical protein
VLLKKVVLWLKRGQNVPFLREIYHLKKMTPKYNAASGIIAGELLRRLIHALERSTSRKFGNIVAKMFGRDFECSTFQHKVVGDKEISNDKIQSIFRQSGPKIYATSFSKI